LTLNPFFCDEETGYRVNPILQNFRYTADSLNIAQGFYYDIRTFVPKLPPLISNAPQNKSLT